MQTFAGVSRYQITVLFQTNGSLLLKLANKLDDEANQHAQHALADQTPEQ
jgi:hypothetical protein